MVYPGKVRLKQQIDYKLPRRKDKEWLPLAVTVYLLCLLQGTDRLIA